MDPVTDHSRPQRLPPRALFVALLLVVSAARADDPSERPLEAQSIKQVVEFYVQDEALCVRTAMRPTNGLTAVDVKDMPGSVRVDVTLRSRRDQPGGSLFFKLLHSSPEGRKDGPSVDTNLFVRPGYLQLNRVVRDGDELWSISLTQSGDFGRLAALPNDRDDRVSLRARRVHVSTGELAEDLARSAPSFVELLRRFPHDAAQHLGPVFRDFGQESTVFGADGRVAWQVLSSRMPRDRSLLPQVQALVAQLDAGDYRVREAALARLREIGGPAALVLSDMPRKKFSPEQNRSIEAMLADYRPLSDEVAAARLSDPEFLLSCLAYSDDSAVRAAAAGRLAELTGKELPSPPPQDREQRLKLVEELRKSINAGEAKR
jgi:hypothetical protein